VQEPEGPAAEEQPQPIARRGFFARLFRRREPHSPAPSTQAVAPVAEPPVSAEAHEQPARPAAAPDAIVVPPEVAELLVSAVTAQAAARPAATDPVEPAVCEPVAGEPAALESDVAEQAAADPATTPDLAAELLAAEEEVTAVLTAVLDRLGAAHHRPFSRS